MWRVEYRPEVLTEDFVGIPRNLHQRIVRAIEERLMTDPARYGVRLRRSLRGLWKLRVGDYRIVYQLAVNTVTVWMIDQRRKVYDVALRRWVRGAP